MTLALATTPDGRRALSGDGPFRADSLGPLVDRRFDLPCGDPWLLEAGTRGHAYLQAAARSWRDHPEWMDFLDMNSPAWDLKRAERDLYLDVLGPLQDAPTVLDVGCGVGRMTQPFLDRGATVFGCDGDLESLRRCAWHAANRAGSLDLFWTSTHALPTVEVDFAMAVEVLCYVEDPGAVLAAMFDRIKPGGHILLTMEARWGWAISPDAPAGEGLDGALGDAGPLELSDRFVHVLERDEVASLLEGAGFSIETLLATHYFTTGPLEGLLPDDLSREQLADFEAKARHHPVWAPLNRIWTAVGRRA